MAPPGHLAGVFAAALRLLTLLTLLTGLLYPLALTTVAQLLFPAQAAGSLAVVDGQVVGSLLIGQPMTDARYFWPRPSAVGYMDGSAPGALRIRFIGGEPMKVATKVVAGRA